ncbi:single-stranded DNA-binding protein [Myxococcota bacterium]|nr:single-stranded DNA-binding protein [Myxococcota bacterium]
MLGVNRAVIVGTLGRDPEVRSTTSGTAVATFTVATNRRVKSDDGNGHVEETEWHRIVAFGSLAENCGRYLQKGRSVYLEGRLRSREWKDKDGNPRHTTEIVAQDVTFLPSGPRADGPTAEEGGRRDRGGRPAERRGAQGAALDDLPF